MKKSRFLLPTVAAMLLITGLGGISPGTPSASANGPMTDDFRIRCVTVDGDATKVVEPACTYLAAIESHDGSQIQAAPDVWRIENGKNTATSATELKESMGNHFFRDYVQGLRDIRWYVTDDEAIAYYVLDIKNDPTIKSTQITERFKVSGGSSDDRLITEIEAVFYYCAETIVNDFPPNGSDNCTQTAQLPTT